MWINRGRFCELGTGSIPIDNLGVLETLAAAGYNGWVFVEQDTHRREPIEELADSRKYLSAAGF